jgi:hypothetical protein
MFMARSEAADGAHVAQAAAVCMAVFLAVFRAGGDVIGAETNGDPISRQPFEIFSG